MTEIREREREGKDVNYSEEDDDDERRVEGKTEQ